LTNEKNSAQRREKNFDVAIYDFLNCAREESSLPSPFIIAVIMAKVKPGFIFEHYPFSDYFYRFSSKFKNVLSLTWNEMKCHLCQQFLYFFNIKCTSDCLRIYKIKIHWKWSENLLFVMHFWISICYG